MSALPQPPRLATILATDAVGYSRAMSRDEGRALAALAASRGIIDEAIASETGRIFSTAGDSVLAEFVSPDRAVRCGAAMQYALGAAAADGIEVLTYRIGIHSGLVHPNRSDLLGDTVNIAARLESIANPGGISISGQVHDQIRDAPGLVIEEGGTQILKGIRDPVRVSRVRLGEPDPIPRSETQISIAILPFRSTVPGNAYWGEGLAEEVIAALSRFSHLAVLARAPSVSLDGKADPRSIAAELGVRFVLTGVIRVEAPRFRLAVQLLDGATAAVLWAERYSDKSDDLLTVQDRVVEEVVATLADRLENAGALSALRKRTESLQAFDLLLQGMHHADRLDAAATRLALDCLERALALDPDYTSALAMMALMRLRAWALSGGRHDLQPAADFATRALRIDPADSWSHLVMGQIVMYQRKLDLAEVHHKKAHALNPYDARIMALWSPLATFLGKPEEGRLWIERAMRLNPHHPAWYATNLGLACYCARQYEDGVSAYLSVADPPTGVLAGLAACQAQLDDRAGADTTRAQLLAKTPGFSSAVFLSMRPFRFTQDADHLKEGLRKAGLPD